jgi:hypothetical protein
MNKLYQFFVVVFLFTSSCLLQAQTSTDAELSQLVQQIMNTMKMSNELLPGYTWTSRTEIFRSNEMLNIMIERNQYNPEGQVVQKLLNEQSAKMPKAFLVKEIAESEKENMEKFLFGLRDFLKKYSLQETAQIKHFIASSTWQVVDSTHEFIFSGRNVEQPGDELIWNVEDRHYSTARIEVRTTFEGEEVYFTGTFTRLSDGLNYLAYAEARIPSKNLVVQVQNFDYRKE